MSERKVINLAERKMQRLGGAPAPTIEVPIPDFITPQDITTMSDEQLEQMLNLIRVRRLQSAMIYENTKKQKEEVTAAKARAALEKKAEQVFTELDKAFKVLEKLELRVNELRALRLQGGLSF